jgi:hypothetical protein
MAIVLDGTNGITTNTGTLISATTIGVGGATPSTSGAGITFPATQSASTNANTLDDYEEGTWTPIDGSGAGLTFSQATPSRYVKIGRMVHINFYITFPVTSNTSGVIIGGLPFTAIDAYFYPTGRASYTSGGRLVYQINDGATSGFLYEQGNGLVGNNNLSNGFLLISGSYMATS